MSILAAASRGTKTKPRRILLYGTHGIGKSTFGAHAPSPVVLDIEGGTGDIEYAARVDGEAGLTDFRAVTNTIDELLNDEHDFRTLVIDSLDWLEQWVWDEVCRTHNVSSIEEIGYGKGYVYAVQHWRDLLTGFDALRAERGMTILMLAHCKVARFESPDSATYDRYEPKLHKHASTVVQDWADEVLFGTYKVFTQTEDNGFNKKRSIGVGSGERVMRCTERPSHLAKNRLGLPDELPLEWAALAEFIEPSE